MIKKFEQYNESIRDAMKPKPATEVNSVLDNYIKEIETVLNTKPYDYDAFTATNFVDFITNYYGYNDMKDIVIKLLELEYMNAENMLGEWIDGVDSVSSYSEDDSKEQLKNFLETIKELKK
jgi:ABC-type transporter Mla subunit MlaD